MKQVLPITALVLLLTSAVVGTVRSKHPVNPHPGVQIVKLRLLVDGKELATISTPHGTTATMSREGGEVIGLTPSMQVDGLSLTVTVNDAVTGDLKLVGRYSLSRNAPIDVSTERTPLIVEWLETTTLATAGTASAAPCRTCCVICDGITFCACEVTTSCGHCCCKDACGCTEGAG